MRRNKKVGRAYCPSHFLENGSCKIPGYFPETTLGQQAADIHHPACDNGNGPVFDLP